MGIWKSANNSHTTVPEASVGHGWQLVEGKVVPKWSDGPVTVPSDIAEEDEILKIDDEIDLSDEGSLLNRVSASEDIVCSHSDND